MTSSHLIKLMRKIPAKPGVYLFKNISGLNLYIGKASNLKNRIKQYVKTADTRLQKMVSLAKRIKTIETDSEIEALILESQYIKRYKPAFNIMLRDDKQFGFVGFTKETYPKIFITHQPTKNQNAKIKMQNDNSKCKNFKAEFIGPFTDIGALKTTLLYLRRIFPYCTCKKPHNNFCLNYHIGKCPGICCLKTTNILNRSTKLSYDNFVELKNRYQKNVKAIKDILNGKKTSLLKKLEKEMIALGRKEEFEEAIELRNKIEKIKHVFENAQIIKSIDISKYQYKDTLKQIRRVFKLSNVPHRIEGYDVANIQGKYAVGAMAVFVNRKPSKSGYRKFKIKQRSSAVAGSAVGGDTGMLKEILSRRFSHPEWPLPDLILIDGGKAQLNAARSIIDNLQLTINQYLGIIALTKDERHRGSKIYVAGNKNSISLSKLPADVRNLILHIDAEAHRFAIAYYRHRHQKALS
ncbi:MAG: GIY-YIG nuclease family protein [Candidatus Yanofskybacteria bacterium]|nr:GIY-YIG nuclease family protein [Candidatus Yanofskybacteria bacterium]